MLDATTLTGIRAGVPLAWDQRDRLDEQRYAADINRCLGVGARGVYAVGRGADGVQLAVPLWMPMARRDVLQFFADVADACPDASLIIYNTARSKHPLGPDDFLDILSAAPTLVGQTYSGRERFPEFSGRSVESASTASTPSGA